MNLRPSGYEPDELPGCSTPRLASSGPVAAGLSGEGRVVTSWWVVGGSGGDLLSHVLGRSTMGAAGFHGRVRNGVGWGTRALGHQIDAPPGCRPGAPPAAARPRAGTGAPLRWAGGGWGSASPGMGPLAGGLWWSLTGEEVIRAIRTGQLCASPRLHFRPIDVVVYHGPDGETWSCGGFPA